VVFISAEINRNYSQIDRLWPILPAVYAAHFAVWARANGVGSERLDTLATAVGLWCVSTSNSWSGELGGAGDGIC
jgi:steroid 5-alpha reductase family enzyme